MHRRSHLIRMLVLSFALFLSACASDDETTQPVSKTEFTVTVNVTGLNSTVVSIHSTITRNRESKSEAIREISLNGDVLLQSYLLSGDIYTVTISNQEGSDICELTNGSGTVEATNVNNILISCIPRTVPLYDIGGTAANIDQNTTGVILKVNGANDKILSEDGLFTFGTPVVDGTYTVTVQNPIFPSQICRFANGTSSTEITIQGMNNSTLKLNCVSQTFSISGNITSLASNGLKITNLGNSERANLNGNPPTSYSFATPVTDGYYDLSISNFTNPMQTCTFDDKSETITRVKVAGTDFSTANISCVTDQFSVMANLDVANFSGSLGLELLVNNAQISTLTINSTALTLPVAFSKTLDDGTKYTVNILSQPVGLTCSFPGNLPSETKTITGKDATTSMISCMDSSTIAIYGNVIGLIGIDSIGLQINNPTNDTTASGDRPNYAFSNLTEGTYTISITPLPTDYDCRFPDNATTQTVVVATGNKTAPTITCRQQLSVATLALADANLQTCLSTEMAGPPVKLYIDEITSLSCGGASVTDLTGIATLWNLATLILPNNSISDISALSGLNSLLNLNLSNNLLTDVGTVLPSPIPVLEGLTSITDLNLGNAPGLTNKNVIATVPNIPGLIRLNLNNTSPTVALTLTNLTSLSSLMTLNLDGDSLTVTDLTSLAGFQLTQLDTISISDNAFAGDIAALARMTTLKTLLLMNNTAEMTNVASLAGLTNAVLIDLTGSAATLCSEIEALKQSLSNTSVLVKPEILVPGSNCMGVAQAGVTVSGMIPIPLSPAIGLNATSFGLILTLTETVPNNAGGQDVVASYDLTLDGAATTFAFPQTALIPVGSTYQVTVRQQPDSTVTDPKALRYEVFCSVDATTGGGTIMAATGNITDVKVTCTNDPLVADVAAFNTAMGIVGDIYNQCIVKLPSGKTTVSQVGTQHPGLMGLLLNCNGSSVENLAGSQYLQNLLGLLVSNNLITDISPVTKLSGLVLLSAFNNKISTLPLTMTKMLKLSNLELQNNQITDVSPLKNMKFPDDPQNDPKVLPNPSLNLNNINGLPIATYNQISNVAPLASLVTLTSLDLQNIDIGFQNPQGLNLKLEENGLGLFVKIVAVPEKPDVLVPVFPNMTGTSPLLNLDNNPYMACTAYDLIVSTYPNSTNTVAPSVRLDTNSARLPKPAAPNNYKCTDYTNIYQLAPL